MKKNCLSGAGRAFAILLVIIECAPSAPAKGCSSGFITFELITGYVYTSPTDTMELVPGTLHLDECLQYCSLNDTCQAVNFETGLCVLFSSSATQNPASLTPSQFPVFTIYGQKVCLLGRRNCERNWMFERVSGHQLRGVTLSSAIVMSREACMELCLNEMQFKCRSANYNRDTGECFLSDQDRASVNDIGFFGPSYGSVDYLENNCAHDQVRLCEFRKLSGKILKTVDAVFQDVATLEDCRQKCLSVNYRCQSFDYGDPSKHVCRLSHHSSATLTHIQEPYLDIPGVVTYEMSACYNVTIHCGGKDMVVKVKTNKLFSGRIYAKSRPNSCVNDIEDSMEFEIAMAYHDLNCDVKQRTSGQFSNDIVIQHHDMIVTNQDLGLSLHCYYDLSNRSVYHGVELEINGEVDPTGSQSAIVSSPNITMTITDRNGHDVFAAQVGDPLALRFEITDLKSPFEIFVRELIAMDGVDNSEILLIDSLGCPKDASIMEGLKKINGVGKSLQAPFDAFKFPTSDIVQFKALVTPCLPACEPVRCNVQTSSGATTMNSMGRRKRNALKKGYEKENPQLDTKDDMVVVQTIHITDKFGFPRGQRGLKSQSTMSGDVSEETRKESPCVNLVGFIIASSLFLAVQLLLILAWAIIWQKRRGSKADEGSESNPSFSTQYYTAGRRY